MRLTLIRHPKPACEPGLCYGHLDLECDAGDLALAVARLRGTADGASVHSSPLRRALSLARELADAPLIEPRLRELDFGAWEGRRWSDLGRAAIDAWRAGLPDAAPPGGESLTALASRCNAWLAEVRASNRPVVAVTHAGPIRVLRALVDGSPLLTYFDQPVPYAIPITLLSQNS